jgi:hypothetical protein
MKTNYIYFQIVAMNIFGEKTYTYESVVSPHELPLKENVGCAVCLRYTNKDDALKMCDYFSKEGYVLEVL